ncbi:MAG: aminotransferase class III-fold pyridoxal phosphate-dependent enzyme, partial [Candidatus Eremiobacteraeota bacterium]|nr:aminotransferase class III-fold pyridoxal phosphate-dependent enzyme [Candidatus Eremiobacteraeota bacterium]
LGKIIGGGLPVGAFGGRAEIMAHLSPDGPVYQAGTLSGNPLAMASGIATLNAIAADGGLYERLEELTARLCDGLDEVLNRHNVAHYVQRIASMFCVFFTEGPVVDLRSAQESDRKLFAKYFGAMLDNGVYVAPSQFETNFLSAAHTAADVDRTVTAANAALDEIANASTV